MREEIFSIVGSEEAQFADESFVPKVNLPKVSIEIRSISAVEVAIRARVIPLLMHALDMKPHVKRLPGRKLALPALVQDFSGFRGLRMFGLGVQM